MSSWKDKIQKKYGPHEHCVICGKAVPESRKYCTQGCKDSATAYENKRKKKSRVQMYFFVIMIVVMIIILIVPGLFGG